MNIYFFCQDQFYAASTNLFQDLLLAATLVANAMEGKTFDVKREPRYVRSALICFMIYSKTMPPDKNDKKKTSNFLLSDILYCL